MASTTSDFFLGKNDRGEIESNVVIKVKYGDHLRRFNAFAHHHLMIFEYDMNKLRAKILSLFDFDNDAISSLTYTDDDGDAISLTDDNDLRDAVLTQRLNPLRITVFRNSPLWTNLTGASGGRSQEIFSELATELNCAIEKSLLAVSDPVRSILTKLSSEVIHRASSAPILNDLLPLLFKLQLPNSSQTDFEPICLSEGPPLPSSSKGPEISCSQIQLPTAFPFAAMDSKPTSVTQCYTSGTSDQHNGTMYSDPCSNLSSANATTQCPYVMQSPVLHSSKKSLSYHDRKLRPFHKGVICDGCGMHPIFGTRYKSNLKENYDLCGTCFRNMGKETDYTRIDWSSLQHLKQKKDHCNHKYRNCIPAILGSCFVRDVTVWDGTVVLPSSRFTKIWRVRNNGTIAWPRGTRLVWLRGDYLGGSHFVELEIAETGFPVNEELDLAVDFFAPSVSGCYTSFWRMTTASSQYFGDELWVIIQVKDQPSISSPTAASPALLNLNLPPESGLQNDSKMLELLNPVNSDLLNSSKLSFSDNHSLPSLASNPLIDMDPLVKPPVNADAGEDAAEDFVEKTLMRELQEMGFRQADLNKEVLRQNQYDLEQSVQDLCGYAEWDPLLKDLQEMGFNNQRLNRKLLSKNNGSLKRVVMELIAGEKAI